MAVKSTYNVPITTNFLGSIAQNFLYGNNALTLGNGGFCLGNMLNGTIGYGGSTAEVVAQYTAAGLFGLIGKVENYFESRSYKPAVTDNYRQQAEAKVDEEKPTLQKAIDTAQANVNTVNQQGKIITDAQSDINLLNKDIQFLEQQRKPITGVDDDTKKANEEANKKLDEQIKAKRDQIDAANAKIDAARLVLNRLDLGVDLSDVKALTEAANNALTAAKDAKETAIKTEIANIKKKEQVEVNKPKSTSAEQKAQAMVDKQKQADEKEQAKAKKKEEKKAADLYIQQQKDKNKQQMEFVNAIKGKKSKAEIDNLKETLTQKGMFSTDLKNLYDSYMRTAKS